MHCDITALISQCLNCMHGCDTELQLAKKTSSYRLMHMHACIVMSSSACIMSDYLLLL